MAVRVDIVSQRNSIGQIVPFTMNRLCRRVHAIVGDFMESNPTHTPTPLEPCPFCGGKASVIKGRVGSQFGQELNYVAVGCWNEGCKIRPHINGRPDWENKWIEEWNIRAALIVKCVNEYEPLQDKIEAPDGKEYRSWCFELIALNAELVEALKAALKSRIEDVKNGRNLCALGSPAHIMWKNVEAALAKAGTP